MFRVELAVSPGLRFLQLALEGGAVSAVASLVAWLVAGPWAGLVAMFLLSAALSDRIVALLEENRTAIWERAESGWLANLRTALGLGAVFAGVLGADFAIATVLGPSGRATWFAFAGGEGAAGASFGGFVPILVHNLNVLLTAVVLGFLFRAYGGMLALAWNAGVWSSVLASAAATHGGGLRVLVAVTPHLLLESAAYVLGVLAAIFAGKAVLTHDEDLAKLIRPLVACALMLVLAVGLIALGAAVEAHLPALVLRVSAQRPVGEAPPWL